METTPVRGPHPDLMDARGDTEPDPNAPLVHAVATTATRLIDPVPPHTTHTFTFW